MIAPMQLSSNSAIVLKACFAQNIVLLDPCIVTKE